MVFYFELKMCAFYKAQYLHTSHPCGIFITADFRRKKPWLVKLSAELCLFSTFLAMWVGNCSEDLQKTM